MWLQYGPLHEESTQFEQLTMAAITLDFPDRFLAILKKRAGSEGKSLGELISDAVFSHYGIDDPKVKAETHLKLCERLLREGEELLAKKDYVQASGKFWGAASQMVKALAAERGLELRSHGELHSFVAELMKESGDLKLEGSGSQQPPYAKTSTRTGFRQKWLKETLMRRRS